MLGIITYVVVGIVLAVIAMNAGIDALLFLPIYGAVGIVLLVFTIGKTTKCPKCGKTFAMKEKTRKTTGSCATAMDVKREVKNAKGDVVRTYIESVPATRYYYDCIDECKFCGHRREVKRQATYRNYY